MIIQTIKVNSSRGVLTLIFTLLITVIGLKAFTAETPQLTYLGIEDGLSHNSVQSIAQDSKGFLWFGTYDGLNRFDGYDFKVYRNKLKDSSSLPHNYIYCLHTDYQRNLWVGTGQGACLYNERSDSFSPFYYYDLSVDGRRKLSVSISEITSDRQGNVFIGTNGRGLIVRYKGSKDGSHIPLFDRHGKELLSYNVRAICVDKKGRVWVFVSGMGLYLFDKSKKVFRQIPGSPEIVYEIVADSNEGLWIGSISGLYKYQISSGTWSSPYNEENKKLTANIVSSLSLDKQGSLWIGTKGGGVNVLNLTSGKLIYIRPGKIKNSLSSEYIAAIFQDREGRNWIGTVNGGLNIVNPGKARFRTISHDPLNKNSLVHNFASSFCLDQNANLWIGTDGGGISVWNRRNNRFSTFSHEAGKSGSLRSNWVSSILKDHEGKIWVATFEGGINRLDEATGKFKFYSCYNDIGHFENKNVWLLYEDRSNVLWASTFSAGKLYRFNRVTDRFEVFDQEIYDLNTLTEDRKGSLWGGDYHELIKLDKFAKKHTYFEIGKPVRAILEDTKGNFWIGTEGGGLLLFDRRRGKEIRRFSTSDGLANNSVLTILEDKKGILWMSTFNGISSFNPRSRKFKNFYQEDGLQSNQFLYRSGVRLPSGEMAFGGIKGFSIFHPDSITLGLNAPPLFITGIRIMGSPVTTEGPEVAGVKDNSIKKLRLSYDETMLSFDFAALEYSSPKAINYAYFLEGWDKAWNYCGKLRSANYTKLREGRYVLRIKSTNAEGVWVNNAQSLEIIVLPPWWRSWWAYGFYLSAFLVIIHRYNVYQREQERLKYQIQLADAKVIQEKELNEKKLSFFTQISHEFRTPLTLIINPIKEFLNSTDSQVETKELIVVYRNATRLLSLVDQLLHFRKTDANQLKISKFNAALFCKEVYLCFVQQARLKEIKFDFICEKEEVDLWADKEKIEIALFNLISNAFKFTPAGGTVQIILEDLEMQIIIKVKDTGSGIDAGVGDRIFENFFQISEKGKSNNTGFGIGLHMVKEIAQVHKGKLFYNSRKGEGSEFILELPQGYKHFDSVHLSQEQNETPVFIGNLIKESEHKLIQESVPVFEPSLEVITEKNSVLVVDDNIEIRNYVKGIFQGSYVVFEAASGEDALRIINIEIPDIVITDVVMGEMSGVDLCAKIKEDPALTHIPVILLTSGSSAEIKLKGIESGADDFITKPFDKEILIARVVNLLKSRNNLQKHFFNQITLKSDDFKVSPDFKEFLEKCIEVTENHLDDPGFNVKILAEELHLSHSALYKRIKLISGRSANEFIRFIRLRKAAQLFINTDCNISEGAYQCGFNDVKYFREQFSKVFGMKPSEYIKIYRKSVKKPYKVNRNL
ncbi:hybrid sensor histidine kinase/response regulator transcription factor [Desertivirga arenae]|uniref:hybrid sensor histidine kinase/response regulator transcription factor n=1 Tax=Desertivirga arenae TaxID=2810309 RepID=UPI001A968268|nr:two-component regulator propeller domain-containing protein [Pedobacter sp. SYSU D00823]